MRTLSTVPQPPPADLPDLDMQGAVAWTAGVHPKRGEEFVVCNPMDELAGPLPRELAAARPGHPCP